MSINFTVQFIRFLYKCIVEEKFSISNEKISNFINDQIIIETSNLKNSDEKFSHRKKNKYFSFSENFIKYSFINIIKNVLNEKDFDKISFVDNKKTQKVKNKAFPKFPDCLKEKILCIIESFNDINCLKGLFYSNMLLSAKNCTLNYYSESSLYLLEKYIPIVEVSLFPEFSLHSMILEAEGL